MKNYGNKIGKMGDGCELQGLQRSQDYVYPDPSDHFTLPSQVSLDTSHTMLKSLEMASCPFGISLS
jgi:hypothetical protein